MVNVYPASKLRHSGKWLNLENGQPNVKNVKMIARWPKLHVNGIPDNSPALANLFWKQDQADVIRSDVVMVYAEPQDHLRGALVEAGMGIAYGKTVIVIGDHPDYGSWQYHRQVIRAEDYAEAMTILRLW